MAILVAGSEGEYALFENTLVSVGEDAKHRGSVELYYGDEVYVEWTASSDIWVHVRLAGDSESSNSSNAIPFFEIRNGNGPLVYLQSPDEFAPFGDLWSFTLYTADSNAATTHTAFGTTFSANGEQFHDYDFRFQISGSDLTITMYRDGQRRFIRTISGGGWSNPSALFMTCKDSSVDQEATVWVQDVIVTDAIPTVGMELATLVPSAAGEYSDFGNDYTNIDEPGYDSSDVITTDAGAQRESWIFGTPTFVVGDKLIYAVVLSNVAQLDLGGSVSDLRPFFRIDATNYDQTALGVSSTAPENYISIVETNPDTSQPWTTSDLLALEVGLLSVA